MKENDLKKIKKTLEKDLDSKRYEHTLGVAYISAALAMRYGADLKSAQIAGLLHDCAKCLSDHKRLSICEKHNISITDTEKRNPFLLHAKVGAFLAAEDYKITDPDIIQAILNHTTGRPEMSLLEKIVFVADYIEPGRKQAPNLTIIRKMAFEDLDQALLQILEDTLEYLRNGGGEIDTMTENTYEYYKQHLSQSLI
ncbi:MAG: HD domain-containing protein [Lachnospiraceae bacterium]|nr:HD domain-containing protein [Lachnospiraceae bacterium]